MYLYVAEPRVSATLCFSYALQVGSDSGAGPAGAAAAAQMCSMVCFLRVFLFVSDHFPKD
jgi:hypothetical protein